LRGSTPGTGERSCVVVPPVQGKTGEELRGSTPGTGEGNRGRVAW
jgi:hypothetical protein